MNTCPDVIPTQKRRLRRHKLDRKAFVIDLEVNAGNINSSVLVPGVSETAMFTTAPHGDVWAEMHLLSVSLWLGSTAIKLSKAEFDAVDRAVLELTGRPVSRDSEGGAV